MLFRMMYSHDKFRIGLNQIFRHSNIMGLFSWKVVCAVLNGKLIEDPILPLILSKCRNIYKLFQ